MEIRIGIRPSHLALKQAEEVIVLWKNKFAQDSFVIRKIFTLGDKDKSTPISAVEESDFFTKEIDEALLSGEIDVGVHSSKDLPENLPKGLKIIFETDSISHYDVLISRGKLKFWKLPKGSRIGCSSQRRKNTISALRKDLRIVDIRGNIEERISLIKAGKVDAVIVAHAAMIRLGLEDKIAEILPINIFKTHIKQGSLSLVAREDMCIGLKSILSGLARVTGN